MPSSDSSDGFSLLLDLFCNIPISTFLVRVLSDPDLIDHPVICDLSSHFPSVLSAALSNEQIGSCALTASVSAATDAFKAEIALLSFPDSGFHFNVRHATSEQLDNFNIRKMALQMENLAPLMSTLVHSLSNADSVLQRRRQNYAQKYGDDGDDDEDDLYEGELGVIEELGGEQSQNNLDRSSKRSKKESTAIIVCIY